MFKVQLMVKHCTIGLKKNRRFHLTFEYDLLLLAFTVKILKAYHNIKNGIFMSRDKIGNSFARVIPYIGRSLYLSLR